MIEELEWRK